MASYLFELSYTLIITGLVYYFLSQFLKYRTTWNTKKQVTHWVLFGFVVNLYGLSWLYTVYPLPWITQNPLLQLTGIALLHLILSGATALPYGVIACNNRWTTHKYFLPGFFAFTLVIAELCRSLIISLLYYGKGTTIALHFTAGTLGNALSSTPLIEFAYYGGTFSLTFVLGYLIYIGHSYQNIKTYWIHGIGITVCLLGVHYLIPITLPSQKLTVGVVTTNFKNVETSPESDYAKIFRENAQRVDILTRSLASSSLDIIVYPEDTRYLSNLSENEMSTVSSLFKNTLFVDGDLKSQKEGLYNISLFYSPYNQKISGRGKELLLPFNEYIPYFFKYIFTFFVDEDAIDFYTRNHTYTPIHSKKTIMFKTTRIGTLICSEILSFSLIHDLAQEKPDIVFFQSHLQVFHENPWFDMFLRSFTKVAAAQMRTTLISSVSGASSYMVSPYGTILDSIPAGFATTTERVGR
jgi:apolipoprotein N-acyltransferase